MHPFRYQSSYTDLELADSELKAIQRMHAVASSYFHIKFIRRGVSSSPSGILLMTRAWQPKCYRKKKLTRILDDQGLFLKSNAV